MTLSLDPPNAFSAALFWLEGTLLGTVATAVAVIAVAGVGFLLLSGRVDLRRAAQVVFACFVLFGASTIASGIVGALDGLSDASQPTPPDPIPPISGTAAPPLKAQPAVPYDPYAGAALPPRR